MGYKSEKAKLFLDEKQNQHFEIHGVFADTNSKIAEWMEEYAENKLPNMNITVAKIKKALEKDYGYENLDSEREKWFVDSIIKDTLEIVKSHEHIDRLKNQLEDLGCKHYMLSGTDSSTNCGTCGKPKNKH